MTISNRTGWKILFFISILSLISGGIKAQESTVHSDPEFENPADFRQYEEKLIRDINWLAKTSRDTLIEVRKLKEELAVKWIYGCPYI